MAIDRKEAAGSSGFHPKHTGVILAHAIDTALIPKVRLASHLGVSRQSVYQSLNGERAVTADMAARLGRAFGISARFWLNLQAAHDSWAAEAHPDVAAIERLVELARDARPANREIARNQPTR